MTVAQLVAPVMVPPHGSVCPLQPLLLAWNQHLRDPCWNAEYPVKWLLGDHLAVKRHHVLFIFNFILFFFNFKLTYQSHFPLNPPDVSLCKAAVTIATQTLAGDNPR